MQRSARRTAVRSGWWLPVCLGAAMSLAACGGPSLSHASGERAHADLPDWAKALYRYLVAAQIDGDANPRFDGGWPVTDRLDLAIPISRRESDLFTPLQLALTLHRLADRFDLPELAALDQRLAPMVAAYLEDARTTDEPAGSVNFWALYRTLDGGRVHAPGQPLLPTPLARLIDIPNDLDTASQLYLWLGRGGGRVDFQAAYLDMLGRYLDLGRSRQAAQDDQWKSMNSGAFLTWNDPDKADDPSSRIPLGINDVDCVVNLNVLHSLAQPSAAAVGVSPAVAAARDAACALVRQAMTEHRGNVCATYYADAQFHLAFARALRGGVSCLAPAQASAQASVLAVAQAAWRNPGADPVELAESLLALKLLRPVPRDDAAAAVAAGLSERLMGLIEPVDADGQVTADRGNMEQSLAALPEGFLYRGRFQIGGLPIHLKAEWRSRAMATAEGLLALLTD